MYNPIYMKFCCQQTKSGARGQTSGHLCGAGGSGLDWEEATGEPSRVWDVGNGLYLDLGGTYMGKYSFSYTLKLCTLYSMSFSIKGKI